MQREKWWQLTKNQDFLIHRPTQIGCLWWELICWPPFYWETIAIKEYADSYYESAYSFIWNWESAPNSKVFTSNSSLDLIVDTSRKLFLMQFLLLMVCGTVDSGHIADQTIRRPTCSTLLSIRQPDQPMNILRQEFVPRVLCIIFVILIIAHIVQHTPIFVTTPTNGSR